MITRTWFCFAALLLTFSYCPAAQHAPPDKIDRWEFRGTIGELQIQANLAIKGDTALVSGYYFSADRLEHIQLNIQSEGENFVMTEPGGAIFRIHQQPMDSKHIGPLDFYNNNGLAGTWSDGQRTLPVKLSMDFGAPTDPNEQYDTVTDESATLFEAKVQKFRNAALAGNKAEVANAISYPLRVNGKGSRTIRNGRQLIANWPSIFTPGFIRKLRVTIPHEMFTHNGMAALGNGLVWFDNQGARAINLD